MINPSFGKSFLFLLLSRAAMHQNFVFISLFFRLVPFGDSRIPAEKGDRPLIISCRNSKNSEVGPVPDTGFVNKPLAGRSRSVIIGRLAIVSVLL